MIYDVVIIGSGIIGSFIAFNLSKYNAKILIIDKENDIANEVSMANSAIIHVGDDPKDNTLKEKLNLEGAKLYPKILKDLNIRYLTTGSLTIMNDENQINIFNQLINKSQKRNINYEILDYNEAKKLEPNLSSKVIKAIYHKDTKVIIPWEASLALLETAIKNGISIKLNTKLLEATNQDDLFILKTNTGLIKTKYVINAAGLYSDAIAKMINPTSNHHIIARKGEYFVLSRQAKDFVNHIIYPLPTDKGKGILTVPTVDGNILLGPTADEVSSKEMNNTTSSNLAYIKSQLSNILDNIPYQDIIRTFAGIRPSTNTKDFIIEKDNKYSNWINLIGIDSPGLASAPAIAQYVETLIDLPYPIKAHYETTRNKDLRLNELSPLERDKLIKQNPNYGIIICRCEQVSKQEIIDAIKGPLGARSIKAIKKRVRPLMGKCQGGFCEPLVLKILADTLKIDPSDVVYDNLDSKILLRQDGDTNA